MPEYKRIIPIKLHAGYDVGVSFKSYAGEISIDVRISQDHFKMEVEDLKKFLISEIKKNKAVFYASPNKRAKNRIVLE